MPILAKVTIASVLMAVALFSAFGFASTFEPPGYMKWRVGYAVVVWACMTGILWVAVYKKKAR